MKREKARPRKVNTIKKCKEVKFALIDKHYGTADSQEMLEMRKKSENEDFD